MSDAQNKVQVTIEGRKLSLSNLDKPLYPHFTKGEVIDYYTRIAPVLLPHLRDRVATRLRFPEGVDGLRFFEKNAPRGTPEWVRTETVQTPGGRNESVEFVVIDDLATLVWCANLAALELHVPQWRIGRRTDLMVFDLDPGEPATFSACCEVGLLLRDVLAEDGLDAYPKNSGKKGLHLYVPVKDRQVDDTSAYAKRAAERLAKEHPKYVVSRMDKSLRGGKVFVDWSQNNPAKTTVAPYSLRAAPEPRVSTPLTWEEVEKGEPLPFTAEDVLVRVAEMGDLLAPLVQG
ncbi:non-homologous end-joining DNA ligase [Actinocorallia sp. A-T 12471]|uniref:non-homologous end-joining DNA ligase n=1 Tax=Actinocorallia sp. A-T 12471 TaxID=3089813 RepID=UPI0029CE9326|nr:non-homologous end-joining DNA ligase [Actinocorallia sp. A-T 12471]MDX6738812.1 non-homologous end-joining DNA ligase [Actinocorallia sp. A-T 12471]